MKQTQKTKEMLAIIKVIGAKLTEKMGDDFIKGVLANREIAEEWVNTDKELYDGLWNKVDTPEWGGAGYELRDPKPKREITHVAGATMVHSSIIKAKGNAVGRGATSEQEAQDIIRRNDGANIIASAILDAEAEIGEPNPEDRACYPVIRAGVWGVGYYEKTVGILLSSSEVIQKICNKLSAGEIKLP